MDDKLISPISTQTAEHYTWGNQCDGWHLVKSDSLSIIQERMPPGTSEIKHYHRQSRQFFFILSGEATMEIGGKTLVLRMHEGVEIPPFVAHQMRNESENDLWFTVTSTPKSHGDRVSLP
ncbi:cupin domain-containing protein [Spirosoma sp. BT702]|uniref:Cupin domain-containing protein n=1 Tax=Spirosoma profusum TaxID=2771354 RepID=A0A926XTZ5_9BACT|nr:cupin domain-containing protein [Spirosoma profusum]MBD2700369.1 cupin domain-containing protein [Spirosoma profusum]